MTWAFVVAMAVVVLISAPRANLAEALGAAEALAPWIIGGSVILAALALGGVGDRLERRLAWWIGFPASVACWAVVGLILGLTHDLFAQVGLVSTAFQRGPAGLGIVSFAIGFMGFITGVALVGLLASGPGTDPLTDLTRREKGQVAVATPVFVGQGALLMLLPLARMLDWSQPGAPHGVLLFLAGAAFLASIYFSVASYVRMDELERNLTHRQTTATFVVFFFLLAAWALAEAIGFAPRLDAFAAFLLLNAAYLGIAVPWLIWSERSELAEIAAKVRGSQARQIADRNAQGRV